jgi:hypothetical protein
MQLDPVRAASVILKTCTDLKIDFSQSHQTPSFEDKRIKLLLNLIKGAEDYSKKGDFKILFHEMFTFSSACYYLFEGFDVPDEDYLDQLVYPSTTNPNIETEFNQFFNCGYKEVFTIPEKDVFGYKSVQSNILNIDFPENSWIEYQEPIAIHLNYLLSTSRSITIPDYYDFATYFTFMNFEMFVSNMQIKLMKSVSDRIIDDIFKVTEKFNLRLSKKILSEIIYNNIANPYVLPLKERYFEYLYRD